MTRRLLLFFALVLGFAPAANAQIQLVATSENTGSGTTLSLPVPAGVRPGDVMVAFTLTGNIGARTVPAGWSLVDEQLYVAAFVRVAAAGEPADYAFANSVSSTSHLGMMAVYRGVNPIRPVDGAMTGGRSILGITTTVPDTRLVAAWFTLPGMTLDPPASMTLRGTRVSTADANGFLADETVAAVGSTGNRMASGTASDYRHSIMVALAPAPRTSAATITGGNSLAGRDTNGWRFVANRQIDVQTLGVWDEDGDGLPTQAQVGLWTDDGVLLGSVTIPAGTEAPLVGGVRYADVSPTIRLQAGTAYRVGAVSLSGSLQFRSRALESTFSQDVQFDSGYFALAPNVLSFPALILGNPGPGLFGANFRYVVSAPPTFSKVFVPASISSGGTSTLTYTIDNGATGVNADALQFSETWATLAVAATPHVSTTCSGATVDTTANGISMSGASLGANASCTVSVDVTSSISGAHATTSQALTSSLGNSGTASATLTVVNLPPTLVVPGSQQIFEDGALSATVTVGDDLLAAGILAVTATSSNQALLPDAAIAVLGSGATRVVTGALAANAVGTTVITVSVSDGSQTTNDSFMLTVTGVNDPPSFTVGGNAAVDEDAGPQTVAGWATAISAGPPNESAQTLTFAVTGNTNPSLFSAGPSIAPNGTLTYTPAADAHGSATVTAQLRDSGGVTDGGVDVSAPATFTITVSAVNDAPSFVAGANQTVAEDAGPRSVAAWATNLSAGPADESGQALTFEIVGNTNPSLFAAGPSVSADGTLTYTLVADALGSALVSVRLRDDGGTANGGRDVSEPASFGITVESENDAPTVTAIPSQTIAQNGATSALAFVVDDIDDAPETLSVSATSSNTTVVSAGGVVVAGSGRTRTVTVTPLTDRVGDTTITLTVSDGTARTSTTFLVHVQETTRPDAPIDLVASTRGNTVTLTWRVTDTAPAHYIVETSRTPFGTSLPIALVPGDQTTFAAPLAQGTYFFRVRGQNSAGLSDPSNEAAATVGVAGTPGAPTALLASIDGNRVTLVWQRPTAGPAPTTYFVDLGTAPGLRDIGSVNLGSAATTTAASLADGTYVARVRAHAGVASSAASNDVAFTIGNTPCVAEPTTPVMLTPSVTPDLVTLTWLAPASGATSSYQLVAGSAPGLADLAVFDTASNATAVRVATPPAGTYYVYVVATNACGVSAASNVVPVTVSPAVSLPSAPRQLTAAVNGTTVAFSWTAPSGGAAPFYYLLEAGSAPGLADYAVLPIYAASTTITVPGVPPARYYLRVRAITMGGAGVASNEVIIDVP